MVDGATYDLVLPNADVDYIQKKIVNEKKPYELEMLRDMRQLLKQGDLVLDIGANVGNHTLYLGAVTGCHIEAFEPSRELCEAMLSSIRLNSLGDRVNVHSVALGRAEGTGRFDKVLPENLGAQQVIGGPGPLRIRRLDGFKFSRPVSMMKVDVEGMELDVLEGALGLIRKDRPRLYLECRTEEEFQAVQAWLARLEYGYWETFNSTPTHLFIPNEVTTEALRLARIQRIDIRSRYLVVEQSKKLESTRKELHEANLKYRASTAQVRALRARMTEGLAAQKDVPQPQGRSEKDLGAIMHERLSLESRLIQLEQDRTSAADQSLQLRRLQDALENSGDQIREIGAALKVAADEKSLFERAASQSRAQELSGLRVELAEANAKYAAAAERAVLLQARLLAEENDHEQKKMALNEVGERFKMAERRNDEERAVHQRQLGELSDKSDKWREAEYESRLEAAKLGARLETASESLAAFRRDRHAEAGWLRCQLVEAANQRETLLDELRQVEKELVWASSEADSLREKLEQALGQRRVEHAALSIELSQAIEKGRLQLDEIQYTSGELRKAQLHLAVSEERANGLALKLDSSANNVRLLLERTAVTEAECDSWRVRYLEANGRADELTEQAVLLKSRLAAIESESEASVREAIFRLAQEVKNSSTQAEQIDSLKGELADAEMRLAAAIERVNVLVAEIDASATRTQRIQEQMASQTTRIRDDLAMRSEELSQEQSARAAIGTQNELTEATLRDKKRELTQLQVELLATKQTLAAANAEAEELRNKRNKAEQQVVRTRAMLSFQLGYLLLHCFKSFRAFRELPGDLWRLRRMAVERKARGQSKEEAPQPSRAAKKTIEPGADQSDAATEALVSKTVPCDSAFLAPDKLKRLKVAAIMDEFTQTSFDPECNLLQLTPEHWLEELSSFKPELLFIESAWRGKDQLWGGRVGHLSREVMGIVEWCQKRNVATVFWNKEDPIHFETFLNTAKLFDHVFTTDFDCIHRYKAALGHGRVYLLPFAAQPAQSNPLEKYERKDAFCFAGAYYVRYPERTRDLGNFMTQLAALKPIEIYDRNYGTEDVNHQFPNEYRPFIVGNLPFDQIDRAYKGYRYSINLNSVKQSQTMFARRVYELLASNTTVVSNFSRGVRLMFGDLVITTDNGDEAVRQIKRILKGDAQMRKHRLAGLRKVMREHTYQDRLAYVASKAIGFELASLMPRIAMLAYATTQTQVDLLFKAFARQVGVERRLYILTPGAANLILPNGESLGKVELLETSSLSGKKQTEILESVNWLASIVPEDFYGAHYLLDLALATRYSDAKIFGKVTHYVQTQDQQMQLVADGSQYRHGCVVPARASLVASTELAKTALQEWVVSLRTRMIGMARVDGKTLALDEFNYCKDGELFGLSEDALTTISDEKKLHDVGISLPILQEEAELTPPATDTEDGSPVWSGEALSAIFPKGKKKELALTCSDRQMHVESALADGKHEYVYSIVEYSPHELGYQQQAEFYLDISLGLNIQLVALFLDANKQRISHIVKTANRNHAVEVPAGTEFIKFGLRVYGPGACSVHGLVLGHRPMQPPVVLGHAEHLLLTNHYPSDTDLYRNGFVHSRVRAYRERGVSVDVFRLRPEQPISYHGFEGIDVTTGPTEALDKMLASGRYKSVLVHFLDSTMWDILRRHIDRLNVVVWLHGAEIQAWDRRGLIYKDEHERASARAKSEKRTQFWREILRPMPDRLKLVFVSSYFAEQVMESVGFRLPEGRYSVIHNPIDTDLFSYQLKDPEQRKKILSIRPYASSTYANDLSVEAILKLSEKPWFGDIEFRMIGDGALFEETLKPIRKFKNVLVERRFLRQTEIAQLHKKYGVFLCPTRSDTHGVSRDEAMSSGLIPVTNAVAAIPEFVDESSGVLAPGDDAAAMADGIERIYKDSTLFAQMSEAAARRVRNQTAKSSIIESELREILSDSAAKRLDH